MLGIVPPTRPGDTQPQCHGDRYLARVLGLLREERAGTLTIAALRAQGISAPGQAVYDLQVAGYAIDRVSCVGPDGHRALGYRLHRVSGDTSELAPGRLIGAGDGS